MSMRGLHTRPATPRISARGWRPSLARSALVTMMAVALSVSTQQSSRCSGLQMMRLASTSSTVTPLLVVGLGVVGGMHAVRRAHRRHLRRRGAVVVHVAHEGGAEHLPRALPAVGAVVQHLARHRHRRARARAADAHLGVAVHGAEDDHGLAHAGLHHAHGDADQRLRRGAAAEHVHVEVEADAEIAGDEGREGGVARLVGQHAVDVGRLSARRPPWRSSPPRCRARAWSCRSRACRWSRPPRRWRTCLCRYFGLETSVSAGNGMGRDPPCCGAIVPGSRGNGYANLKHTGMACLVVACGLVPRRIETRSTMPPAQTAKWEAQR